MKVERIFEPAAAKALWIQVFREDAGPFADWYFANIFPKYRCFGIQNQDKVVSMAVLTNYRLNFRGRVFASNFLQGVSTDPAEEGRGYASSVIAEVLRQLGREGQAISSLVAEGDGIHSFYQRLGYATYAYYDVCEEKGGKGAFQIISQPGDRDIRKMAERYARFMRGAVGFAERSQEDFAMWAEAACGVGGGWLIFSEQGYTLAVKAGDRLQAAETVFFLEEDLHAFGAAAMQLGFTAFAYRRPGTQRQGAMLRIVNPERFLEGLAAQGEALELQLEDAVLPENSGRYLLYSREGRTIVERKKGSGGISVGVDELAQWAATGDPYGFFPKAKGILLEEY